MELSSTQKKWLKIALFAGIAVLVLGLLANFFLQRSIHRFLNEELAKLNSNELYRMEISDVDVNIFGGNITMDNLSIVPTDSLRQAFLAGESTLPALREVEFASFGLRGLSAIDFISSRKVNLSGIRLDELNYRVTRNPVPQPAVKKKSKGKFSLDSLQIPGIKGISVDEIMVRSYGITVQDGGSGDTLTNYRASELKLSGVGLKPLAEEPEFFTFDNEQMLFELSDQQYTFSNGLYRIRFEGLLYSKPNSRVTIDGFHYEPVAPARETARKFDHTNDIFDAEIEQITITDFELGDLVRLGRIDIGYVELDSLYLKIFKDKRLPWDYNKRPKFPNQMLQSLRLPLTIDSVRAKRTYLDYTEQMADDKEIHIYIDDMELAVDGVTSVKSDFETTDPLTVNLKGNLLNTMPFDINLSMPYTTTRFSYWGNTGTMTSFESINPIIYPAINMKFEGGTLNGIDFDATATPSLMEGQFTMYYTDLEVQVFTDEKKRSKNNTVSWLANSFAKQSNPKKNGKLSVASMKFERVEYKGIGNFLWKGLQSGIINSVVPFGKRKKL